MPALKVTRSTGIEQKAMSRIQQFRVGMHILILVLGVILLYDYARQPENSVFLFASLLFLGYGLFRLVNYRRGQPIHQPTPAS